MKTANLLDSVRIVKENEKKAAEFYADAAEKTGSSAGRDLFGELVKFENFHYHWLTVLEKSLKEKGQTISYEGRELTLLRL
jgi:rubrerythrin